MALDRFSRMVQQFGLLSFQGPALLYEAGPLESALGWMLHTVMHGVVCEPFEFGSLGQHLDVLSVFQGGLLSLTYRTDIFIVIGFFVVSTDPSPLVS